MAHGHRYIYEGDPGTPLQFCPDCGADLTEPDGVTLEAAAGRRTFTEASHLDEQGVLVDVDELIEKGYHSGTCCAVCDASLATHEDQEYEP